MSTKILTLLKNLFKLLKKLISMRLFLFILLCFLKIQFVFGEKIEDGIKKNLEFEGNFNVFTGHNNKNINPNSQERKNMYAEGYFKIKQINEVQDEEDFKYGISATFNLDSKDSSNPLALGEFFVFSSDKKRGNYIIGIQNAVSGKMRVDTTLLTPVSGGINGSWQNFLIFPNQTFITRQGMWLETGFASTYFMEESSLGNNIQPFSKWNSSNFGISFVTERVKGFRMGISYIPDNRNNFLFTKKDLVDLAENEGINYSKKTYLKNIISGGINFYEGFGDAEIAFSALTEVGKSVVQNEKMTNLNSYSLGLNLSYLGFTIGGNFTSFKNSLQVKNSLILNNNAFLDESGNEVKSGKNYIFDAGVGYAFQGYATSLSTIQSRYLNNKFSAFVFSLETDVKNLGNYLQIARYNFKNGNLNLEKKDRENHGWIVVFGIKYNF